VAVRRVGYLLNKVIFFGFFLAIISFVFHSNNYISDGELDYGVSDLNEAKFFAYWPRSTSIMFGYMIPLKSISLVTWTKHGHLVLSYALFHPVLDLTIYMDIAINPGPMFNTKTSHESTFNPIRNTSLGSTCLTAPSSMNTNTNVNLFKNFSSEQNKHAIPVRITARLNRKTLRNTSRPFSQSSSNLIEIERSPMPSTPITPLTLCSVNARSLKNKSADFYHYVSVLNFDLIVVTETWLTSSDSAVKVECTPPGYILRDNPRIGRIGGGTALLCRENIAISKVAAGEKSSFEFSEWIITSTPNKRLRVTIVYRPPYSVNHPVTTSVFLNEFAAYLETVILSPEALLITGDFNIHVDSSTDQDATKFLDLLDSMALTQHVHFPTHEKGHTLDLIITRRTDSLIANLPQAERFISDHCAVLCQLTATSLKSLLK
jgi:exonuclease III